MPSISDGCEDSSSIVVSNVEKQLITDTQYNEIV